MVADKHRQILFFVNAKDFRTAKNTHVPYFAFSMRSCSGYNKTSLPLPWTGMSRLSLHPVICVPFEIPHRGFLPVFTVIFDKTQLNDASLANDTWKNHLSVHYCFFRFLSDRPTASAPISVLFFPFIIKLGITSLPGLFSTQQLHTDVETLSFMVFGGKMSG